MKSSSLKIFDGANVLVTGHTGFKGSWLCLWLLQLGAKVTGISLNVPTQPSHFEAAVSDKLLVDHRVDIRDSQVVQDIICSIQPRFVFHLAAQALVRPAYQNPIETYQTNFMGTVHVLEAMRQLKSNCTAVMITSDKCYNNVEWVWGYRETDDLGGTDPYSASKAAAEIVIRSYIKSFFNRRDNMVGIAVARAGNVIGGGDWAMDRVVPDCVRAWSKNETVQLRNPWATRPWQHVLEPLSGYLVLASELAVRPELHGEAFNFGPSAQQNHTVMELVEIMSHYWEQVRWKDISSSHNGPHESGLLRLNCDKALCLLNWRSVLDFKQAVKYTSEWYRYYYQQPEHSILDVTLAQIAEYEVIAREKGLLWAN